MLQVDSLSSLIYRWSVDQKGMIDYLVAPKRGRLTDLCAVGRKLLLLSDGAALLLGSGGDELAELHFDATMRSVAAFDSGVFLLENDGLTLRHCSLDSATGTIFTIESAALPAFVSHIGVGENRIVAWDERFCCFVEMQVVRR